MKRPAAALAALLVCLTVRPPCSDRGGSASRTGEVRDELLTDSATMMGWIARITERGIRRPGYAADDWTEQWAAERFREYGLGDVTLDRST